MDTNQTNELLSYMAARLERYLAMEQHRIIAELQARPEHADSASLIPHGWKLYSQNEEDGMIREIFKRIGTTNKVCVELGAGDGLENNTLALLFEDWRAVWVEGDARSVQRIRQGYARTIGRGQLSIYQSLITTENINRTLAAAIEEDTVDLLSVDIDGNDCHVLEAINAVAARVIVIEYNAKFPPPVKYCMRYDPQYAWDNASDDAGASLSYLAERLGRKGYALVACNLTGSNAFFVQADLAAGRFHEPFTAEHHYQPPRYFLSPLRVGHLPSYRTLDNRVTA